MSDSQSSEDLEGSETGDATPVAQVVIDDSSPAHVLGIEMQRFFSVTVFNMHCNDIPLKLFGRSSAYVQLSFRESDVSHVSEICKETPPRWDERVDLSPVWDLEDTLEVRVFQHSHLFQPQQVGAARTLMS